MMDPRLERLQHITRRHFFKESQVGLGAIGLSSLLADAAPAASVASKVVDPLAPRRGTCAEGEAASSIFT